MRMPTSVKVWKNGDRSNGTRRRKQNTYLLSSPCSIPSVTIFQCDGRKAVRDD